MINARRYPAEELHEAERTAPPVKFTAYHLTSFGTCNRRTYEASYITEALLQAQKAYYYQPHIGKVMRLELEGWREPVEQTEITF